MTPYLLIFMIIIAICAIYYSYQISQSREQNQRLKQFRAKLQTGITGVKVHIDNGATQFDGTIVLNKGNYFTVIDGNLNTSSHGINAIYPLEKN